MTRTTRRQLLKTGGALTGALLLGARPDAAFAQSPPMGWGHVSTILRNVRPPRFPNRDLRVTDYGAAGDGTTLCTEAFRAAIADCTAAGGGRVVVPAGEYLTGAIHLADDVNLHVTSGATVRFSRDPQDYLPAVFTRYEGVELFNYSPFVYAYGRRNIAVTGGGTLDGRADPDHWWNWTGGGGENVEKAALNQMAADGVPVEERAFGDGHRLRVNLVQFYRCENILIEGVTVKDSPMWNIHPVLSRNITVRDVTVDSPHGPNNDGCNPESCSFIHIQGSRFNTGDDCVAFKAGKDADGRRVNVPCVDALVEGCEMRDGNGGVTVGSETSGGVGRVFARDCVMSSPRLERALRVKTNPNRGGYVTDLHFNNITVGEAADAAVEVALDYAGVRTGDHYPLVRGIDIRNLTVERAPRALYLIGNDGNPIRDLTLTHCTFAEMEDGNIIQNVEGLVLRDVTINGQPV